MLFDEIEKAAPSLTRLLLGVLDRGMLRLGDNSVVNFEKSLVFLTSNLGAREMMREINPDFGFQSATTGVDRDGCDATSCRALRWSRCGRSSRRNSSTASTM